MRPGHTNNADYTHHTDHSNHSDDSNNADNSNHTNTRRGSAQVWRRGYHTRP